MIKLIKSANQPVFDHFKMIHIKILFTVASNKASGTWSLDLSIDI